MQETQVQSLGWEDPLEEGMATHSSVLAWRIPRTEEAVRLQSMGQKVSDMSEQLSTHMLSIKIQIRNSLILIQMTPGISLDIYFSMLPSKHIQSESEVVQLCPTLCNPMDYSPPGSSVHGIFQARVLEWVAISFSRGSFRPRD